MSDNYEIVKAIKDDDLDLFQRLISSIDNVSANLYSIKEFTEFFHSYFIPITGISLLHISANFDSIECFKYLHEEKQISLRHPSRDNFPPIYYACCTGSLKVVKYILNEDPSQSQFNLVTKENRSLLNIAVIGHNIEIVEELLLKGAKVTDPWTDQYLIISDAMKKSISDIRLFQLIYSLRDPNFQPPPDKPSFVMLTILNNNPLLLDFIIQEEHIDFTQENNMYLIEIIIEQDRKLKFKDILIKILSKDTENIPLDPPENSPDRKFTACNLLCMYMDLDVAKLILQTKNFNINSFNNKHETGPAVIVGRPEKSKVCNINKFLIEKGFDINIRYDEDSPTLLEEFITCLKKNFPAIELLIDYGADINATCSKKIDRNRSLTLLQYVNNMKGPSNQLKQIFNKQKEFL